MNFPQPLVEGYFRERKNRFSVKVDIDGESVPAHLPNSGRLNELLLPGRKCYLIPKKGLHRKTSHDLVLVALESILVSTDARLPNHLIYEALKRNKLEEFAGTTQIKKEVQYGRSRFDFLLQQGNSKHLLEVKSVTLVVNDTGLFPDAPTERGKKHILELIDALNKGYRTSIIFCIQREDCHFFKANNEQDPDFSRLLKKAYKKGVSIFAYKCRLTKQHIEIVSKVPVLI